MGEKLNKLYRKLTWKNYPSPDTPINERNLNHIETGIDELDDRVIDVEWIKFDASEASMLVKDVTLDEDSGILTVDYYNGAKTTYSSLLSKIAVNFDFNKETQKIILFLRDGEQKEIDLSAFITEYEFVDTETINIQTSQNGTVSAIVKEGSIEEKHLRPDYLADIKVETAKTESNAASAAISAKEAESFTHGGTGIRPEEETDNAKYYKEQAEVYYENLQQAGNVTGVKGNAETTYRNGNVNITPANIGAAPTSHASTATTYGASSASNYGHAMASATTPKANGTASVGTETAKFARGDHVHPLQTSVAKLTTPRTIDGVSFDGSADITHFGVCYNVGSTVEKKVAISGFELITGARVSVYFPAINSAENPTLNVSNTGAKPIYDNTGPLSGDKKGYIGNGTFEFVYTGSNWNLIGNIDTRDNTVHFTSVDSTTPTGWTDVSVLKSEETHESLFNKISTMFKNVRYLYKLLGKTGISTIGDGTVTGILSGMQTKTLTITTSYTSSGVITCDYNDFAVSIYIYDMKNIPYGTSTVIGTLPKDLAPKRVVYSEYRNPPSLIYRFMIDAAGKIFCYKYTNTADANSYALFTFVRN